MPPAPAIASSRSGSVIVMVLLLVVLLTFIVTAFLTEATAKIKYYGLFHNRDDLRTDAYSALEIALGTVNQYREIEGALWGPDQGWGTALEDFEFEPRHATHVTVTFQDESAKFALQALETDVLLVLFEVLGFSLPDREALTDGLLDWMDTDDDRRLNGFDGDDYEDFDPPLKPANGPIQSWDEFRLIEPFRELFFEESGLPLPVWNQFVEAVSLHRPSGQPNINQASPTVLAVLEEMGHINARSLEAYRHGADGEPGTGDERLLRTADGAAGIQDAAGISTSIELLRVKVEASRGDARFQIDALVTWAGSDASAAKARSPETTARASDPIDSNDDSAKGRLQRGKGSARTAPALSADLGYPFRFVRISENRKF
jgi:hypothetical protein